MEPQTARNDDRPSPIPPGYNEAQGVSMDAARTPKKHWTQRFNTTWAAGAAIALAVLYLTLSLASEHSATSTLPTQLDAQEAGVEAHTAAALLVGGPNPAMVLDTRGEEQYNAFHLSGAVHLPDASTSAISEATAGSKQVLIIADTDAEASKLAAALKATRKDVSVHFLQGGARSWYLTFELPVALFNEKPPPFGYEQARQTVQQAAAGKASPQAALAALQKLKSLNYAPALLKDDKPKASGKKRKKISGGCGG